MCYRWLDYSRFGHPIKDTKIIAIKCPMKEVVVVVLFHNSNTGFNTEQLLLNDILYCDLTQLHYLIYA